MSRFGKLLPTHRNQLLHKFATLILTAMLVMSSICPVFAQENDRRSRVPNVILILADDLGYADLGIHGGKDVPTPQIDALANSGVRLTNGYVSGPYCSPTRAGLLTGRYQQRFGHEFNPGGATGGNAEIGLPVTETTVADRFSKAGYRTGLVGKWHLGNTDKLHPQSRGFEEFFGFLGGAHSYVPGRGNQGVNAIRRGRAPVDEKEYLTDAFAREAVAYIDRHKDEPFFLLLSFNAVHTPLDADEKYLKGLEGISDPRRRAYAALLVAMDHAVGRVVKKLQDDKLEENTLVIFFSDNGGPPANASSNGPLRGNKAQTWEGGVRVPFFVSWKGKLPAGKTYDQPAIQLDIAPTALAAAGIDYADAKFDGVNILPHLAGENTAAPHDKLYWRFGQQTAIRAGDWKLVKGAGVNEAILVNLADDLGETKDLSSAHPEKRKELEVAWQAWNKELEEPRWKPNPASNQKKKKKKANN